MAKRTVLGNDAIHTLLGMSFRDNESNKNEPFSDWESDNIIHHGYNACKQSRQDDFCHPPQSL